MVGADGEVGRRRPRLDLLVRAIEEWESILSGGMELDGTLLARLEKMVRFNDLLHPVSSLQPRCRRSPMRLPSSQTNFSPYIPLSAGSGEKRAATTRYLSMARSAGGASGSVPSGCMTRIIARPWRSSTTVFSPFTTSKATLALEAGLCFLRPLDISHSPRQLPPPLDLGAGLSPRLLVRFSGSSSDSKAPKSLNTLSNRLASTSIFAAASSRLIAHALKPGLDTS